MFRHYWVVTKLLLTVIATAVLLLHTQPIDRVAAAAAVMPLSGRDLWQLRVQLGGDASAALFALFVTTTLSVYKAWGMTPYGLRQQFEDASASRLMRVSDRYAQRARAGQYVVLAIVAFVLLILLLHFAGPSFHEH